jgi:hypothetical protein
MSVASYLFTNPTTGAPERMDRRYGCATSRAQHRPVDQAPPKTVSRLALFQGVYFVLTGLWGLLHDRSFQFVTGPKTDVWLLKTVSVLVIAIGGALTWAGFARRATPEIAFLGASSGAGLMAVEAFYVARRRISPIYLLDAVVEAGLVAGWLSSLRGTKLDH